MENGRSEKYIRTFVSQDDPVFRAEDKKLVEQAKRGKHETSFGAHELSFHRLIEGSVQRMEARVASGELEIAVAEKYIKDDRERTAESVRRNFDWLLARRQHPYFKTDISLMLVEALNDTVVETAWGDQSPARDDETFWELFLKNEIPRAVLVAILEQRERRQGELQRKWEGKFEGWRVQFRLQLEAAVADGVIPSNEHYNQRIDDVRFLVADPVAMGSALGRSHGAGILSVQVEFREENAVRKTVFHEMMHHISGGAIQKTDVETYEHNTLRWQSTEYVNRKGGLAFNSDSGFRESGVWLNEGMTELLARYLAKEDKMTSYPHEQMAILEIIQSGTVPQKLFTDAYFEGHLEKPENGSRLPAFRALSLAMTKAYGAGWSKIFGEVIQDRYKKLEE